MAGDAPGCLWMVFTGLTMIIKSLMNLCGVCGVALGWFHWLVLCDEFLQQQHCSRRALRCLGQSPSRRSKLGALPAAKSLVLCLRTATEPAKLGGFRWVRPGAQEPAQLESSPSHSSANDLGFGSWKQPGQDPCLLLRAPKGQSRAAAHWDGALF